MENKLVHLSIKILRMLPADGLHFNAIFKQTGLSYKPDVVKAVSTLGKSRLIFETRSPTHKQKKIQQLTELGTEIVKLISDIEEIHRSHSDLKELLIEKFGIAEDLDETHIKNRLRSRRWASNEILFYGDFTKYAILLITESLNMIYSVLTYRYSVLSLKYDIKGIARLILDRIILDALKYHVSNAQDTRTIRQLYYMKDNNEGTRIIMDRLRSSIVAIEKHNSYLNRFTVNEGARLLSSICGMLEVPKNVVEDYISKEESSLRAPGLEHMLEQPESHYVKAGVMYWNPYKDARRISNRILSILHEMLKKSS